MRESPVVLRAGLLALFLMPGIASAVPPDARDPWESTNRAIFRMNDRLDRYLLKPLAKAYHAVTPQPVDNAVSHFFNNLGTPWTIVNALLQGKPDKAAAQTSRFMFNSTFGVAGLFDVASAMGLPPDKEDFGQTLGVWGVKSGPYVMLPVLGPSTVRDTCATPANIAGDPRTYLSPDGLAYGLRGLDVVDTRADLLDLEKTIEGDRYLFIRDYYLQQRDFAISDGQVVKDDFLDDTLSDEAATP